MMAWLAGIVGTGIVICVLILSCTDRTPRKAIRDVPDVVREELVVFGTDEMPYVDTYVWDRYGNVFRIRAVKNTIPPMHIMYWCETAKAGQ